MKKIVTFLAVLMLLALPACKTATAPVADPVEVVVTEEPIQAETEVETEVESEVEATVEVETPAEVVEQVTIDYAKNFTLEYKDGYKLLTVTNPWFGATEPFVYALVPADTTVTDDLGDAVVINTRSTFVSLDDLFAFPDQIDMLSTLVAVDTTDYTTTLRCAPGQKLA